MLNFPKIIKRLQAVKIITFFTTWMLKIALKTFNKISKVLQVHTLQQVKVLRNVINDKLRFLTKALSRSQRAFAQNVTLSLHNFRQFSDLFIAHLCIVQRCRRSTLLLCSTIRSLKKLELHIGTLFGNILVTWLRLCVGVRAWLHFNLVL